MIVPGVQLVRPDHVGGMSLTGPAVRAGTAGPHLSYGRPDHGAGRPYDTKRYGQLPGRGHAPTPVREKYCGTAANQAAAPISDYTIEDSNLKPGAQLLGVG